MKFSDFAAWLLRSPLYWMMGPGTMLIQVTGRRSGKPVNLPVNYMRDGADLWVISKRERVWWRNLQDNPQAELWIKGKKTPAQAELVLTEPEVNERLGRLCTSQKWLAAALHVGLDASGRPQTADLQAAAKERLFVRLVPQG